MLAEVSINPFGTAFRFSLGPVGLAVFALFFLLPAYLTGAAAGLIVPLVHAAFAWLEHPVPGIDSILLPAKSYVPETLAYTLLGTLLFLFRVGERTRHPLQLAALLATADVLANVAELFVRGEPFRFRALMMMVVVALGRAAVSQGTFYILQEGVRERQWAEERRSYMQRLLFTSNLQTEAFFLQKSSREIEQIMARAHRLYRELSGHQGQPLALEIAKDIHEVKKDYQRTLGALFRLVAAPQLEPEMNFAEIVALVFDANQTYAVTLGKGITLESDLVADFRTARYGRWVSILNNLVSNAVEATGSRGCVKVIAFRTQGRFVLRVVDTGPGIPQEDWELIFSPGFTTKLNPVTGAFSSGIGLTHVVGLVKAMNGTIRVEQSDMNGTSFRLEIPWEFLEAVECKE